MKSHSKNAPSGVYFLYAWTNYTPFNKLTLGGAQFPSIDGKSLSCWQ
jgi:hypothetical protein